jgi:hypothetical protein
MKTTSGDESMGRFSQEVEVANNDDVVKALHGLLEPEKVRRVMIQGVVDSGAARLVLPESVAKKLGLRVSGEVKVRYADHRTARRKQVEGVYLELLGRHSVFNATVEPKRETALIGAIRAGGPGFPYRLPEAEALSARSTLCRQRDRMKFVGKGRRMSQLFGAVAIVAALAVPVSLGEVLGKNDRIVFLEIENAGGFQPVWLGIRLGERNGKVVGFVD